MAKLTINDILGQYGSSAALNVNFDLIEAAVENTLSRDGTSPNQMEADIDLNSNDLNNVGNISANNIIRQGQSLVPDSIVAIDTAASVPNVPAGGIAGTNVQAAINELDTEKLNKSNGVVTGNLGLAGYRLYLDSGQNSYISSPNTGITRYLHNNNQEVRFLQEFNEGEINFIVQNSSSADRTMLALGGDDMQFALRTGNSQAQIYANDADYGNVNVVGNLVMTTGHIKNNFRGALVVKSADQAIANNATANVTFDVETYDTDSIHNNTNSQRLTVPAGVTKVRLQALVRTDLGVSPSGGVTCYIFKSPSSSYPGYSYDHQVVASTDATTNQLLSTPVIPVTAGEYFVLNVQNTTGVSLDVQGNGTGTLTWFAMEIIE